MRKIVMLGAGPRTQRSHSSVQLPPDYNSGITHVPLFTYRTTDFVFDLTEGTSAECNHNERKEANEKSRTKLKDLLHSRWEIAKEKNAFNYNLNCMYKFLDGQYNFSIQLNVERGELRRKPMRFRHIREPFNPLRFNFTKLNESEVLLYLRCEDRPISSDPLDRHMVAVNASPLERDHSLIVPAVNKCLPQVLTPESVRLATDLMLLVDDDSFHVLFNSLLGQASVNHLHMHALYWPYDSDLINRRFEKVAGVDDVFCVRPPAWMCSAFAFQLTRREDYDTFMSNVTKCVSLLTDCEQAHNLFFTRAQKIRTDGEEYHEDRQQKRGRYVTAYVFPRMNMAGAKPPTNFNPAACELAGCLTAYTFRFFEAVTEQAAVRIVEEEALIPDETFQQLCSDLSCILNGRPVATRPCVLSELEGLTSPEIDELRDSFQTFEPHSPARTPRSTRERTHSAEAISNRLPY